MIDKLGCSTNITGFQLTVFMRIFLLNTPNITPPGSATYHAFNDSSPGWWQSNNSTVGFPFEIQLLLTCFLRRARSPTSNWCIVFLLHMPSFVFFLILSNIFAVIDKVTLDCSMLFSKELSTLIGSGHFY